MMTFHSVQYFRGSCFRKKFFTLKGLGYVAAILFWSFPHTSLAVQQADSNNERKIQSSFFERKAEGWHWYQDPPCENKVKEKDRPSLKTLSPTKQIETQRKELEKKLHTAIVEPTRENLMAYITAQKALMDQSQKFAEMWKQVVMTTPALDETLQHPVDQNARHVYYSAEQEKIESVQRTVSRVTHRGSN